MQAELFSKEEIDTTIVSRAREASDAVYRHMMGDYDHVINMEPMPTPRPKFTVRKGGKGRPDWVQVYHPTEYTKYKDKLACIVRGMVLEGEMKRSDYSMVLVTFHMPYPQSTPKKNLIDMADHIKKPDHDNLEKGFLDGMADAELFSSDSVVCKAFVRKCYTTKPEGFIGFTLIK